MKVALEPGCAYYAPYGDLLDFDDWPHPDADLFWILVLEKKTVVTHSQTKLVSYVYLDDRGEIGENSEEYMNIFDWTKVE